MPALARRRRHHGCFHCRLAGAPARPPADDGPRRRPIFNHFTAIGGRRHSQVGPLAARRIWQPPAARRRRLISRPRVSPCAPPVRGRLLSNGARARDWHRSIGRARVRAHNFLPAFISLAAGPCEKRTERASERLCGCLRARVAASITSQWRARARPTKRTGPGSNGRA